MEIGSLYNSNTYTGSSSSLLPKVTVDCPLGCFCLKHTGTCSSGTGQSTFTMTNSSSATSVYIKVQYKITDNDGNDGGWVDMIVIQTVPKMKLRLVSSSGTTTINVPVGSKLHGDIEHQLLVVDKVVHIQRDQVWYISAVSCSIDNSGSQALDSIL